MSAAITTPKQLTAEELKHLENELIKLCNTTNGAYQEQFTTALISSNSPYTLAHIAASINQLTNSGRLNVYRVDDKCLWKTVAEDKANKLSSMTSHERVVYAAIEEEGNRGIWIKDLRKRTNISGQNTLEKILKTLMHRKLIKSEKSVAGKNKRVYMLYDLKPSLEVTGGTWYKDHEMDVDFILNMQKACRILLSKLGPMTASQVMHQLQEHKITTVPFTLIDVVTILNTMWHDRSIELVSPNQFASESFRQNYIKSQKARKQPQLLKQEKRKRLVEPLLSSTVKKQRIEISDDQENSLSNVAIPDDAEED